MTGAMEQPPRQATVSRVNRPSFVVPPTSMPSRSFRLSSRLSDPLTWQAVPRQTWIWILPGAVSLNWL